MKYVQRIAVFAVAMCLALIAQATERHHMVATFSSYDFSQGKRYDFEVYEDDLALTPSWRADEEFPPLSPRKAEASARGQLKKLIEQSERWTRGGIALEQMSGGDKWVYIVYFSGFHPPGVIDGMVPQMRLVVLMNGRVIEPRISPYGKGDNTR